MGVSDIEFVSERFTVRHWQTSGKDDEAFIDVVLGLLTPAVRQTLPDHWQSSFDRERASDWLAETGDNLLVVADSASGVPVAFLLLYESDEVAGRTVYRIGYLVAESAWGKGVATEMLGGLIEHCRTAAPLTLLAGVEANNTASRRVLEKCGFADASEDADVQRLYTLIIDG